MSPGMLEMVSVPQLLSFHLPLPFPSHFIPFPLSLLTFRPTARDSPQPRRRSEATVGLTTPSAPSAFGRELGPQDRPRSNTHTGFLRRESSDVEFPTYDKRKHNKIRGLRLKKVPVSIKH